MNYYFAPMDGITDYLYRQIVWKHFPYWDKLYAPFIQPNERPVIVPKEYNEICPENNNQMPVIPQILTRDATGFIRVGEILEDLGYNEINLNLGCPARLIVSKGKGAGMLADTEALDEFLDKVFSHNWKSKITVKTRLGLTDNADFDELLSIYAKYPIDELTIHPRFRSDFYSGQPRLNEFEKVFSLYDSYGKLPFKICYNGNINTLADAQLITKKYPLIDSIMCGRGALADPSLIRQLKGGKPITIEEFQSFHKDVYNTYIKTIKKEKNFLHKMQEMWTYWLMTFSCHEDLVKELRACTSTTNYINVTNKLMESAS